MDWLQNLLFDENSIAHIVLLYSFVIAVGVLLGKIKFFGVSLGVTFVLFTGIVCGHFGLTGNTQILTFLQDFGLILFVFCIGLQVGPSFFSSFKKGGIAMNLVAMGIVALNIAVAVALYYGLNGRIELPMMVGILCGAVTNTPGLGAANEALSQLNYNGPQIAMGYACAYPLGVLGIIGSIIAIRYICQINLKKEEEDIAKEEAANPHLTPRMMHLEVHNEALAGNRVLDILDEEPVIEELTGNKEIEFEGINAEDVTFAYGEETILDNFSIDIKKGEITGIIGKSGSGKSTLLKLFMRFWDTDKGRISISGSDIKNINTSNLRDMEGFMTQDTHLFHDSIKNNIRIAKLDATDEEIVNACKKASIHDFIQSLPQGYDTPVGELGDTLSGGEKQRIGLARVFLHNAPLILLDEPTSNLDSLNEAVILKSLNEERQNKTVVMVSHRQSTMRITDKIYSVENGRMS